jgi:putative NADPH-quinone reductase
MPKHIAIIQGHPDARGGRFGHALAASYKRGAEEAGHEVKIMEVATLEFSWLHRKEEWEHEEPADSIREAQAVVHWAQHIVIFYPLWLGSMPAVLKAFLEQLLRPGFAIAQPAAGRMWKKLLVGKSARIVVTMGMPAWLYRWYFGAHSLKSLERNILGFCGIGPIRESVIGLVESADNSKREKWLKKLHALGREGK